MLSRSVPNARRHRPVATPAIISHNPCLCDEANSARSDTTSLAALRAGPNLGAMVGHLETNYFVYQYPGLGLIAENTFLRGVVSGLGFMNVLLSLEAFRRKISSASNRG